MVRDYSDSYHGNPEQIKKRAQRNAARREVVKERGAAAVKGKDVDHKNPIRHGGGNGKGNLRVASKSENRGWRGGKKGYDYSKDFPISKRSQ
jgi:hypothetical protein